jgi:PAS domain S-box-containing protein
MERELLQAIIDQTADAVVFADTKGTIRIWNAAAERLFGFGAEEAVGTSLDLIIPERLRPQHWAGFDRAMASGATRLDGRPTVTRGLHKSGQRLYVEMTFAVVRDASGVVAGSISIARDVTARYEAERARRSAGEAG